MRPQSTFWIIVAAVTLISAILGFWVGRTGEGAGAPVAGAPAEREILYWVAPMDPNYRRDKPGKSPMGMDLVPVYADERPGQAMSASVAVSPEIRQSLGVRTARAERGAFARRLDTVGYTRWDESTVTMLHPRAEGWLQSFGVASVGDRVREGQVLYELFSPKLVSAQQEFLTALGSGNAALARAARDRLGSLGLTGAQIAALEKSRRVSETLPRRAPKDALVIAMEGRDGNYVTPATHVLTLAELSPIWAEVEVFESDIGWMREGLVASARFDAWPGEAWTGTVAHIYPALDPMTRTLRMRLVFDNADGRLRPNMLARIRIDGDAREGVLSIPREAVIRSGEGERVVVDGGDGRFRVRRIVTGMHSGDRVAVLEGLTDDDVVVVSGQFLLDAEANGEQAFSRLESDAKEGMHHGGHYMEGMDHGGHDMDGMDHSGHDMDEMDHSGHDMEGMDDGGHDMEGMDHSGHDMGEMDHSGHDRGGMDHSGHDMEGMDHEERER